MSLFKVKVFYGWWIVAGHFFYSLLMGGFIILGFTAFFQPIVDEFGWSYAHISLATSLRGIEAGLFSPFVGFLVDRWGPRRLVFIGAILTGLSLIFLSYVNSLGLFYLGFALISIGLIGGSPTVAMPAIANWFRKKLGIAAGISTSGFACGGLLIPFVAKLIDVYDWRTALVILGIITCVLGIPLSLLFRHKPEQYGYLPDGEKSTINTTDEAFESAKKIEADFGTKSVVRSSTFWKLVVSMTFNYIAISAVVVHIMPYLNSVNISRSAGSFVAATVSLLGIIGRLSSGWLSDKFNKKKVAIGFFAMSVLGLLCMSYISREAIWLIVPFVMLFGIGWGGNVTIRVILLREYFGKSNFGSIMGLMMGIIAWGGLVGPIFVGWVYDNCANYQIAWLSLTAIVFLGMVLVANTPRVNAYSVSS